MSHSPLITTMILLLFSTGVTTLQSKEKRMLAYAKHVAASRLDSALPKKPFAQWLRETLGPQTAIKWELNDCGEQTGTAADLGRDFPSCAEADATLPDGRKVVVMIAIGTWNKGLVGRPSLKDAFVEENGEFQTVRRLSELRDILGRK